MKKEAEMNAESDKKIKEETETINKADSVIFQTEKALKDLEDKIGDEDKNRVMVALEELKTAHQNRDVEKINSSIDNVNNIFQGISQNIYQQMSDIVNEDKDVEVTDVDFEEVK
jgi:molecular chaperone DnaK